MKFYKLKHIPTGLYFKPSKHGSKSNLSEIGKLYQTKPSLSYVKDGYTVVIKGENRYHDKVITEKYKAEEWEIEEFISISKEQHDKLFSFSIRLIPATTEELEGLPND